ncbi:ROK family protein [Pseudarthrobacter sp. J75]|uniref:ROK family protein n=1 Tax=unclassified Pseudarthrobacter TaxID=2647000 RepID=UPI002E80A48C|nr:MULTISPECIES: ROK family protein [unclassified Pseudarthrobacter]MEE2521093.1 ROK family protein [Pseudarthrobacter sp. J47]MEE2528323.1 ROK family protein [Pseudarthrobacter sp. J75]MEE2568018.1 ROK family protein [Pseudarthrobacter sp. J64]
MSETAPSTQLVRRVNASAMLKAMRGAGVVTGTDLMSATGLSRATVISICDELVRLGWLQELENQRGAGDYVKGRPARRFVFDDRAASVLGIDIGAHKITAIVADMAGTAISKVTIPFRTYNVAATERADVLDRIAAEALEQAGIAAGSVLAVSVGVAAPVSRNGDVLTAQEFWKSFDVRRLVSERHGWHVLLENDANLAALAERWKGAAQGVDNLVVMLTGDRLGSGVLESGRLLHGQLGGFGELGYLENVDGVGDTYGIAHYAKLWAQEALASGTSTRLSGLCGGDPEKLKADMVFAAAEAGDDVANGILDRLASRMARVVGSVSTLVNPELVVFAGAVAGSARALLPSIEAQLPKYTFTPPRLEASTLGDGIVSIGAVRHALDYVEEHALDLYPASLPKPASVNAS